MNPGWRTSYLRYKSYFLNVMARYRERSDIKAYLEILLSLFTISILSIFALRPTLITIGELIKEIESKRQTLKIMDEKIQNLSRAQTVFEKEKSRISLLEVAIPKEAQPKVFASQVQALSTRHEIEISGLSTGKGTILGASPQGNTPTQGQSQEVNANELEFSIDTKVLLSQYVLLVNFLSDLQKLRIPVKIDSLRISTNQEQERKVLLMTIQGQLPYYLR